MSANVPWPGACAAATSARLWASVRDALATHHIVTIVLPTDTGATLRIRKASTPEAEHRELDRLLGVTEQIVPPRQIWSEIGARE